MSSASVQIVIYSGIGLSIVPAITLMFFDDDKFLREEEEEEEAADSTPAKAEVPIGVFPPPPPHCFEHTIDLCAWSSPGRQQGGTELGVWWQDAGPYITTRAEL